LLALFALTWLFTIATQAQETGRARVTGSVKTGDDEPVPDAKIVLKHTVHDIVVERTTDKNGRWAAAGLRGGQWTIDVYAEGYEPQLGTLQVREARRNPTVEIVLKKGAAAPAEGEAINELALQASEAYQAKDYPKALELYQQLESEFPEMERIELNIGKCHIEMGNYPQGIAIFESFLDQHPGDQETLLLIGDAYVMKGDVDTGIEYLEQVGLENMTDPLLCYNMAEIYFANGLAEKAKRCYGKATELDPTFHEAFYKWALVAVSQNEPDKAIPHLKKVIELAPDSPEAAMAKQLLEQLGSTK
jgi:tetratricopeptide (TPR) repeat protein